MKGIIVPFFGSAIIVSIWVVAMLAYWASLPIVYQRIPSRECVAVETATNEGESIWEICGWEKGRRYLSVDVGPNWEPPKQR